MRPVVGAGQRIVGAGQVMKLAGMKARPLPPPITRRAQSCYHRSVQPVDWPSRCAALVPAALRALGIRRLLLAIHDVSFPSDASEDVGRGSPGTRAAERFLGFVSRLGFTGVQLGPQGQTSIDNASPYDGTAFSRNVDSLPLRTFADDGELAGLLPDATLAAAIAPPNPLADHRRAHRTLHRLIDAAHEAFRTGARPDLEAPLERFRREHALWLAPDALYFALHDAYGGARARDWPRRGGDPLDERLLAPRPGEEAASRARRAALEETHARAIGTYALGQMALHDAHARLCRLAAELGLELYGDFQVGFSDADAWSHRAVLMRDYVMGAPPSRTNPEGQPWGYPILDPALRRDAEGAATRFLAARADKALAEYDSLRLDHPHGLVCPWVYSAQAVDPERAVREGARLFESPDLPDHPALAPLAIARSAQIDRSQARNADGWVVELDAAQVSRYAVFIDAIVATARRHGRDPSAIVCEVLSTLPYPLARVLERHRLGRFRVAQKANLDDERDVYRTENARREDWVMLGTHDTPPIFGVVGSWAEARQRAWSRHLARRLSLATADEEAMRAEPGRLAQGMLAELFACAAENVSIFFGDLFGYQEPFNVPGTVSDANWRLRLPPGFEALYASRVAARGALNLPAALALALAARGEAALAGELRALATELEAWGRRNGPVSGFGSTAV